MSEILIIGYLVEGSTDQRFLNNIIRRTAEDIILGSDKDIELHDPVVIEKQNGTFTETVTQASKIARNSGLKCLCIHCDADDKNENNVVKHKINPALEKLKVLDDEEYCKKIIPIIPVYMTESWILADTELLREEIGAFSITDQDLGIHLNPESYNDPKKTITEAIRISQERISRRRKKLKISHIYQPLGQKIRISELRKLGSYQKFYDSMRSICLPYC